MKKIINILMIIIFTFLVLNCNCYAFDFEFNSNTYSINRDIPKFPISPDNDNNFLNYLLVYNCELDSFDLLCFVNEIIYITRLEERITFDSSNYSCTYLPYIYNLSNNSWVYSSMKTRYDFPSTLGNKVFIFKSDGIDIDSSVYDISGNGSVTLDFIYKQTEITTEGYTYKPVEIEKEITIKDIYNSLNILIFIVTVLFVYLFIKSILRVRG